jgi:hypothetical protein
MNERIQQLAEQALNEYSATYHNEAKIPEAYLKKFAELIVRECINIVKPTSHHEAFAQSYLGDVEGLELLDGKVKQIKQHFGVENENI